MILNIARGVNSQNKRGLDFMNEQKRIEELEQQLQKAINERNAAWFQLEENQIEIEPVCEE